MSVLDDANEEFIAPVVERLKAETELKPTDYIMPVSEHDKLVQEIAELKAKLAAKKAPEASDYIPVTVSLPDGSSKTYNLLPKRSEKGAVSVYGIGRFPVTLYPNVWRAILHVSNELNAWIDENTSSLSWSK